MKVIIAIRKPRNKIPAPTALPIMIAEVLEDFLCVPVECPPVCEGDNVDDDGLESLITKDSQMNQI